MMGDGDSASRSYEDFLALWKNAGLDIPILKQPKPSTRSCSSSVATL